MYDAAPAAPMPGSMPPHAPSLGSQFLAFAARLGVYLLAAVLGVVLVVALFVGTLSFAPASSAVPGPWRLVVIGLVLIPVLTGGVLLAFTSGRTRSRVVQYFLGLLIALLSAGGILVLAVPFLATSGGLLLYSSFAGAIGLVVTYLVAGLRAAPSPYQRYANLGCGIASWLLVTGLTLPVPDQAFTTASLLGLPFAAIGGLLGGRIHHAFLGSASQRRPAQAPSEQAEPGAEEAQAQHLTAQATAPYAQPAKSYGLAWRLIAASLLGVVAVPFGLEEPETLVLSLVVLGFFAGIAIVLDLSLLGWRPGLGLLLCCAIAIAWGGGSAVLQAAGQDLFYLPTGAAAQAPFAAFASICALLCLLSVEGAHVAEGPMPGEQHTMVQLVRHLVFWLAAGLLCWLGIAAILLWRGAPGMPGGSETPGQLPLAAALPLVVASLPAVLLGALVGGALRWAVTPAASSVRSEPAV